jgi:hypothetical protein
MSEIVNEIHESATRLFRDLCTSDTVNSAEAGNWPEALWKAVEEAGLCDVPSMSDWQDACATLRAAGYASAPIPLADTMLGRHVLELVGIDAPEGALSFAVGEDMNATKSGDNWALNGTISAIPFASVTPHLVIAVPYAGTTLFALLPASEVQIKPNKSIAGEWLDEVSFDNVEVASDKAGTGDEGLVQTYRELGALTRAALIAGAGQKTLEQSIQYSTERVQFGRPISAFQAVAFMISQMTEEVAASSAIVEAAAAGDNSNVARSALIAAAKIRTGEAATSVARMSHQVFGAMGVTMEHSLHHSTRRLWTWREEFGGEQYWATTLGQIMSKGIQTEGSLWQTMTELSAGEEK